jgi:glutamate-ammonia-ligase adenylyltransferase
LSSKNKQILSEDFINRIIECAAGSLNEAALTDLFSLIEEEVAKHFFTHSSESNLLRVISGTFDRVSFLSDCIKYPYYIELLISLTSNSNYLTDILVRNPEYFYWIANPITLGKSLKEEEYSQLVFSATDVFRSFEAKVNSLRRLKRKEILRIGAKDIFLKTSFEEVTYELSYLAKAIAGGLFSICYKEILNKYKLELSENRYCLVSLGKLGGDELNYSSDIDLMLFYDSNELLPGNKEFQEILIEAILLFIKSASGITGEGYIYRVDFRLRPDGKNSPLCKSLPDYLTYYEIRGEDWERQMLIKCNFAGGSKQLFFEFRKYLTPFIFPQSFKVSPLEQIKKLKLNIEKNLSDKDNIKLAPGGIRDIEFAAQALQLLNGGKIESLRKGNTLNAVEELRKSKLLSNNEAELLRDAYIFYRKAEHYLQLMNDTQTHTIPSKGEIPDKLSLYLGYEDKKQFREKINRYLREVRKIYNSITGSDKIEISESDLLNIHFSNPQTAGKDLTYLREGKGLLDQKEFDNRSIESFDKIYESLNNYLKDSLNPDPVLKNFVRIIKQEKFPSIWYEEFRDKNFFRAFLIICEFSQFAVDTFAENKKLKESFLAKRVFQKISSPELIQYDEFIIILSVQFTLGIINPKKVPGLLSSYFKSRILHLSVLLDKYDFLNGRYFIGLLGSAGSDEMTFASDIDLIFVTDNPENYYKGQNIFLEYLNLLRVEFNPVKVDCRLRPEGQSGMLVWDIDAYINYINSRARTWELQAFTKMDFAAGNKNLFNQIIKAIVRRLKSENQKKLKSDFLEMRKKMLPPAEGFKDMINLKKTRGGIIDIEFVLQYLIVCNPIFFRKFRGTSIKRIIKGMSNYIPDLKESLEALLTNFEFIKTLILHNQNIFNQSGYFVTNDEMKFSILADRLNLGSARNLEKKLNKSLKENYSVFRKIFGIQS